MMYDDADVGRWQGLKGHTHQWSIQYTLVLSRHHVTENQFSTAKARVIKNSNILMINTIICAGTTPTHKKQPGYLAYWPCVAESRFSNDQLLQNCQHQVVLRLLSLAVSVAVRGISHEAMKVLPVADAPGPMNVGLWG